MPTDIQGIKSSVKTVDQVNLTSRNAYDSDGRLEYYGEASPSSATSDSVWRISKRTYLNRRLVSTIWADGDIITQSGNCFIDINIGDEISLRTVDIGGTGTGNYYSANLNLVRIGN